MNPLNKFITYTSHTLKRFIFTATLIVSGVTFLIVLSSLFWIFLKESNEVSTRNSIDMATQLLNSITNSMQEGSDLKKLCETVEKFERSFNGRYKITIRPVKTATDSSGTKTEAKKESTAGQDLSDINTTFSRTFDTITHVFKLKAESTCLSCHPNVKPDEIMGVLSITEDISRIRNDFLSRFLFSFLLFLPIPLLMSYLVSRFVNLHMEDALRILDKKVHAINSVGDLAKLELDHGSEEIRFRELREIFADISEIATKIKNVAVGKELLERSEEELRETNEKFSKAFDSAPIIISISNLNDGKFLDVNQKFLEVSEFSREEVIGKTSVQLGWVAESDWNYLKECMLRDGKYHEHDMNRKTKSGQSVLCKYWGQIITVAGEKHLLSIALDITEQRKIEQQFLQVLKMESVGRLAGGVAHDFNNMLTVIDGYAQLALGCLDPSQEGVRDCQMEIRKAVQRSTELTRQLLAFARKQAIVPKVMDLNETVSGMFKMLRRIIGEDILLTWRPGAHLWQIMMDSSQIDQILVNLCVNAQDAIRNTGEITIETGNKVLSKAFCDRFPGFSPGEYVRLVVSDSGCGMDKEIMANIFEPFYTTKDVGKGTGLGLATVYGIVKQNEAYIDVNSEPGVGTTFTIYIPRYVGEVEEDQTAGKADQRLRGTETVLLVEDEQSILDITAIHLENYGYTLLKAGSGEEAIKIAEENIDVIRLLITDVVMPGMNGKDLSDNLKTLIPKIKCLYMSGYTSDVIAHHGVLDKGVNFIQKPYSSSDLAAKVREVLDS